MPEDQTNTEYVRERDHLKPVELWDPVEGRMMKPPTRPPSARASTDATVRSRLPIASGTPQQHLMAKLTL